MAPGDRAGDRTDEQEPKAAGRPLGGLVFVFVWVSIGYIAWRVWGMLFP